jgi:hypothetical protein
LFSEKSSSPRPFSSFAKKRETEEGVPFCKINTLKFQSISGLPFFKISVLEILETELAAASCGREG